MRPIRIALATAALLAAFSLPASSQVGPNIAYYPTPGTGQTLAATTTSGSVTFTGDALNDSVLSVYNAGTDLAFCRWGVGAQTATTAGLAIPAGTVQLFNRNGATVFACRTNTTTATIYVSTGNGF